MDQPAEEAWVAELSDPGVVGQAAQQRLHAILVKATRHQVYRLRSQLPGVDQQTLEDLAQQAADDALVAVLGKLDTFEGRSRFTTWVWKFGLLHAGVTVRRQAWRHREIPQDTERDLADLTGAPEAWADASELGRAVAAAMAADLTAHQRKVAVALLIDEVPIDVLAERMGTNRNALYKTLHDARVRLRASLTAGGWLTEGGSGP